MTLRWLCAAISVGSAIVSWYFAIKTILLLNRKDGT